MAVLASRENVLLTLRVRTVLTRSVRSTLRSLCNVSLPGQRIQTDGIPLIPIQVRRKRSATAEPARQSIPPAPCPCRFRLQGITRNDIAIACQLLRRDRGSAFAESNRPNVRGSIFRSVPANDPAWIP